MHEPLRADEPTWSMIARAAAGDPDARSAFARSYLGVVAGFLAARWRGTPLASEVDDAVQQVFVECLREGGVLGRADPARGDLQALLLGVTRRVARRFEERAAREQGGAAGGDSLLEHVSAREPSLSALFDREWARATVRLAGERMRARAERAGAGARLRVDLLRLRFTEGLPIREIADQWEVDADGVHRAYAKAREEFRACLREVVREHLVRTEDELDAEVSRLLRLLD